MTSTIRLKTPIIWRFLHRGSSAFCSTDAHLAAFAGEEVEVRLYAAVDGKKSLRGILGGTDEKAVTLLCGGQTVKLDRAKISRITTVFDF